MLVQAASSASTAMTAMSFRCDLTARDDDAIDSPLPNAISTGCRAESRSLKIRNRAGSGARKILSRYLFEAVPLRRPSRRTVSETSSRRRWLLLVPAHAVVGLHRVLKVRGVEI